MPTITRNPTLEVASDEVIFRAFRGTWASDYLDQGTQTLGYRFGDLVRVISPTFSSLHLSLSNENIQDPLAELQSSWREIFRSAIPGAGAGGGGNAVLNTTSTTTLTVGVGLRTLTLEELLGVSVGSFVVITSIDFTNTFMLARILEVVGNDITVWVSEFAAHPTLTEFSSWIISLSGPPGPPSVLNDFWRGEWSPELGYAAGSLVRRWGKTWIATSAVPMGDEPGTSFLWDIFSDRGTILDSYKGLWSAIYSTTLGQGYSVGDTVTIIDPISGSWHLFGSLINTNIFNPLDFNNTQWVEILRTEKGNMAEAWGGQWSTQSYLEGTLVNHGDSVWVATANTLPTDVPGVSMVWDQFFTVEGAIAAIENSIVATSQLGVLTLDLLPGNTPVRVFTSLLTENTTLAITNAPPVSRVSIEVVLGQDITGNHLFTLPTNVSVLGSSWWRPNTAPNSISSFSLTTVNGGNSWILTPTIPAIREPITINPIAIGDYHVAIDTPGMLNLTNVTQVGSGTVAYFLSSDGVAFSPATGITPVAAGNVLRISVTVIGSYLALSIPRLSV